MKVLKVIDREWLVSNFNYEPLTGNFTCLHTGLIATRYEPHNGYNLLHHPVQQAIRANRAAFVYMTGVAPDKVDHKNKNRADDRWSNLRAATDEINALNRTTPPNNKSGVIGVSWCKHTNSWEVKLKEKRLGRTVDFFEACCLRKSAEHKLFTNLGML